MMKHRFKSPKFPEISLNLRAGAPAAEPSLGESLFHEAPGKCALVIYKADASLFTVHCSTVTACSLEASAMGGHSSSMSANMSTNVVSTGIYSVTQNCLMDANTSQQIIIQGNGNIVNNTKQIMDVQINASCYSAVQNNSTLQSTVDNTIAQTLKDQEVAMTQWLDNSGDNVSTSISTNVADSITISNTQNCVENLAGSQLLMIQGNSNVASNILQQNVMTGLLTCVQNDSNTSTFVQDTTNTINQHSDYVSESPFAFITDTIRAMFKSALVLAAVVFIIIVAMVFLFMVFHHKKPAAPQIIVWPGLGTASQTAASRA
jgi:hypothetical protein